MNVASDTLIVMQSDCFVCKRKMQLTERERGEKRKCHPQDDAMKCEMKVLEKSSEFAHSYYYGVVVADQPTAWGERCRSTVQKS
jgi:hypothetical protein